MKAKTVAHYTLLGTTLCLFPDIAFAAREVTLPICDLVDLLESLDPLWFFGPGGLCR